MRPHIRTFPLLALLTAAMLFGTTRLAACTTVMNISVYSDGDVSLDGSTVYGYSSTSDNSTLCTCVHSNYQATAYLELANGSYVGNTESGETSSVSSATDGDGSYYAQGVAGLHCSCAGNIGAYGTQFTIVPPAPIITGIADASSWSNTIYPGVSGYLAIFGTTLTAWGETPTPTVTGDSYVTIGSVSYASDGQVNVRYSVNAQATMGQHTIALQTARGTARGTVNVACATPTSFQSPWAAWTSAAGRFRSTMCGIPAPEM